MLEIVKLNVTDSMTTGFFLSETLYFRQAQSAYFLADHDAVRQVYSFKGSAGLRPCTLCSNVIKGKSDIPAFDPFFVDIGACDGFKHSSDQEIFSSFDKLCNCRTKADLELQEKAGGVSFDPHAFMSDTVQRTKMPPSRIIYDYMHTYLSNGVASWEIALFLQAVFNHTHVTLEDLQATALADGWKGSRGSSETQSYLRNLFHSRLFGEGLYTGEAHQTAAVLPLLRFYVETVIEPTGQVPEKYIRSFCALCSICSLARDIKFSLKRVTPEALKELTHLQKIHQQYFLAYEVDHKPKHHHRMHLPTQWEKCGFVISCEALEQKHQLYKTGVADRQRSTVKNFEAFSAAVLPRILRMSVHIINQHGLPFWNLKSPTVEADLEDKMYFATTQLQTSKGVSAELEHFTFITCHFSMDIRPGVVD